MTTGICRYKKGSFDQGVLDEVYDLAKVKYVSPNPPSSGLQPNSTDLIWADMHDAPTGYPVSTSRDYTFFRGPDFHGDLPVSNVEWGSVNAWFEVEEATCNDCSCGHVTTVSENTQIELSPIYAYVLEDNGIWYQFTDASNPFGGTTSPSEGMVFTGNRGCNKTDIENIRLANMGYDTKTGARTYLPKYYFRNHGWANNGRYAVDRDTIKAVFFTFFARLIKIDPNGIDDFQMADFVVHQASDIKAADGTQPECCPGRGLGGISRYKTIPKNGDWMPCNFLEGFITKAELDANPPPFPTTP